MHLFKKIYFRFLSPKPIRCGVQNDNLMLLNDPDFSELQKEFNSDFKEPEATFTPKTPKNDSKTIIKGFDYDLLTYK